jgi:hypothetical protein
MPREHLEAQIRYLVLCQPRRLHADVRLPVSVVAGGNHQRPSHLPLRWKDPLVDGDTEWNVGNPVRRQLELLYYGVSLRTGQDKDAGRSVESDPSDGVSD